MVTSEEILRIARGELGYKESPIGSNCTKYGEWFGLNGHAWCMMFVQWVFDQAGELDLLPVKTASCGALMRSAQDSECWVIRDYRPGDVAIYDFQGGAATDHCGIIESVSGGTVTAIEGNTGQGNDANGGRVMRRVRKLSLVRGAVRPEYEEDDEGVTYKYLKDVPEKFRPTIEKLMDANIIQGDGSDRAGNGDVINLTHQQVRTLVFVYRGGGFDRQLQAAGLEPAVQE